MGKMKSLTLSWKHRQTDCRCVDVTGILLLWHAAISVLHLPAWLPHSPWSCSGFCVYAWHSSLAAIFQCVTWSQCRGKRCFLTLGNLRKVGVNFLSTACHILHSQRFCSGVWSHKKKSLCRYGKLWLYGPNYLNYIWDGKHLPWTILCVGRSNQKWSKSCCVREPTILLFIFNLLLIGIQFDFWVTLDRNPKVPITFSMLLKYIFWKRE